MSQKIENGVESYVFTIDNGNGKIQTGDMCVLPNGVGMVDLEGQSASARVRKSFSDEYSNPNISVVFGRRGKGRRALCFDGQGNRMTNSLDKITLDGEKPGSWIRFERLNLDMEIVK